MNRRKFIQKTFLATLGSTILGGAYAFGIEPKWLEFTSLSMPIKNLPNSLKGKKLMQISDMHVGNRFSYKYLIDSFKKAQEYQPDIVVFTGDTISLNGDNEVEWEKLKEVLKAFPKGKLATVAVLGNHDYGVNWRQPEIADEISKLLQYNNIQVLRNEKTEVSGLHILGIDDLWSTNFQPEKVMNTQQADQAQIVLCHNPDVCDLPIWNNYNGWILSGHTHGGQVKAPFLPPFILPVKNKKYSAGKIDLENHRTLYINRAVGHLHQVRMLVRPEITIFELG